MLTKFRGKVYVINWENCQNESDFELKLMQLEHGSLVVNQFFVNFFCNETKNCQIN